VFNTIFGFNNTLILSCVPKTEFVGKTAVDFEVGQAVVTFNSGCH